jgi:DNA-binding beta-propeller fold protein YncE
MPSDVYTLRANPRGFRHHPPRQSVSVERFAFELAQTFSVRVMTSVISLAFTCLLLTSACSTQLNSAELESISLPLDATYPNGIATASDGTLYVGQVTQGGILRRSPSGDWSSLYHGSPEIYAGTSLRLDEHRQRLWGTSPDFLPPAQPRTPNIFALDAVSGRLLHTAPVRDGFGNDIAIEPGGSILITESNQGRLLRLNPGESSFETVIQDARLTHESGIGAAGIARADNGAVVIGNFSTGRLYVLEDRELRELVLPRTIENPDGIAFAPDGSLVVLESAVNSGNGKILRIPDPLEAGERDLLAVAQGLESPVNLSIGSDGVAYVSESRVRHRLVDDLANQPAPQTFRIIAVALN